MGCVTSTNNAALSDGPVSSSLEKPFEKDGNPFRLYKLNADSSWFYEHIATGQGLVVDPWLLGPEVDYCECFNKAWHTEPCVDVGILQKQKSISGIVITLPFDDHCHQETLAKFDKEIPIYCANGSHRRVKKMFPDRTVVVLSNIVPTKVETGCYTSCSWSLIEISPPSNNLNQTLGGVLFTTTKEVTTNDNSPEQLTAASGQHRETASSSILHAPHGLRPSSDQIELIRSHSSQSLILLSTTKKYSLPFFLGGTVNQGLNEAKRLIQELNVVTDFLETHSSPTDQLYSGLVRHLAKVQTPVFSEVSEQIPVTRHVAQPIA